MNPDDVLKRKFLLFLKKKKQKDFSPFPGPGAAPGTPNVIGAASPAAPAEGLTAQAMENGIRRYMAARRQRVPDFVDRHFSFRGSLAIHRIAFGWDMLRAPANLLLVGPHAAMKAFGLLAGKLGYHRIARKIEGRNLLLRTDVSRRIEGLVLTELFELPTGWRDDHAAFRTRLAEAISTYVSARAAASGITVSLLTLSTGALILRQLTPGAVTLGPALAAMVARHAAISAFPLGAGLGRFWYATFPIAPSATLVAGLTGGLMIAAACVAAFAGLATDPIQRRLGLHTRRLHRMLDAVEHQMLDPAAPGFAVHDHYVARLLDLFDLLGIAYRLALR